MEAYQQLQGVQRLFLTCSIASKIVKNNTYARQWQDFLSHGKAHIPAE